MEIVDPFKGKPYSAILEGLSGEARKAYRETPHPMNRIPGTGSAYWDGEIGRYVV